MKPEPERHPVRPPLLPQFEGQLARAEVKPMTIDPSKVTPEVYLLSEMSALKEKVSNVEKTLERIEKNLDELAKAHQSIGWKVALAALSAIGGLVTAAAHLMLHQLKGQ